MILQTFLGHKICGVNKVAKFSADILFCSTCLAVRLSKLITYFNNNALLDGNNKVSNCKDRNNLASNSLHLHHSIIKKKSHQLQILNNKYIISRICG